MSKLVTLQQAEKLKELGFDRHTQRSYQLVPAYACNDSGQYGDTKFVTLCKSSCKTQFELIPAPSIHEALEWFREVKGVVCAVDFYGYKDSITYSGVIYNGEDNLYTNDYENHGEASSALLDALIEYEMNKSK